jgi:alpha-glucuronidase
MKRMMTTIVNCASSIGAACRRSRNLRTRFPVEVLLILIAAQLLSSIAQAEDGYDLWLRYFKVQDPSLLAQYRREMTQIVIPGDSPTVLATRDELRRALSGLMDRDVPLANSVTLAGAVVVSAPDSSLDEVAGVQGDGYRLLTKKMAGKNVTVIVAKTPLGGLYGAFGLSRLIQTNQPIDHLNVLSNPKIQLRMLDHWDNPGDHGTYFGHSLWFSKWAELPGRLDPRFTDYARANASVGINGTVVNDVNADATLLQPDQLQKVAALAGVFRPYGIRVYLSVSFASPLSPESGKKGRGIGDLDTADPQDPRVAQWWKTKADEIYTLIPDFGGFLVKADSEGMPGPKQYGRSHVEAANMLAAALAPHGGILMWRAFVYDTKVDPDRAKRSYTEFKPLDGEFASNAILQVKNGPLDFQPREPFHPLWGAMPKTPMFLEFEVKQEYLGRATDLVYLGEEWHDVLQTDTFGEGKGSTVARVVDGSLDKQKLTGIAGVANLGDDRNWCGHPFDQANWYVFGRLGWNPDLNADAIAEEWARMTWSNSPVVVKTVTAMMRGSWQSAIDVRGPLGLDFTAAVGNHHDPDLAIRVNDYWFADKIGVGYDRTDHAESGWKGIGSNAVSQYAEPLRSTFNDVNRCPEDYLLWFHFVPWDHKMQSGRTLWDELNFRFETGARYSNTLKQEWNTLKGQIDAERFALVSGKLTEQEEHYRKWRDTSLNFFIETSGRSAPRLTTGSTSPQ